MTAWYRLEDDGRPGRWFLGAPRDARGRPLDPAVFTLGEPVVVEGPVQLCIKQLGFPVDLSLAPFDVPIVSRRVGALLETLAPDDVQTVPARIEGVRVAVDILVVRHLEDCLDQASSVDGELAWMTIAPNRTNGRAIFRVAGAEGAIVVIDRVVDALHAADVVGARFTRVFPPPELPAEWADRERPPGRRRS